MIHRQAKLSPEDLKQVAQIEVSINHWSMEHTNTLLKADHLLENIKGLHMGKQQVMEKAYKEAGIDSQTIQSVRVNQAPDGSGIVDVMCNPPPVPPPAPVVSTPAPEQANGVQAPAEAAPPASTDGAPTS